MQYSPVSSVDSTPHSPIDPDDIDPKQVPIGFMDTRIHTIEPSKRRCRPPPDGDPASISGADSVDNAKRSCILNPERCRAWWTQPSDECWIVNSEQVPRPAEPDPIVHPFVDIAEPEDFRLPNGVVSYTTAGFPVTTE
jgi:hypothetical protein